MARRTSRETQAARPNVDEPYDVVLRTGGRRRLKIRCTNSVLYPLTLAWNEWLVTALTRRSRSNDQAAQRARSLLVDQLHVAESKLRGFFQQAARKGLVQVEMTWSDEETGYAARLFPWEEILRLAAREERRDGDFAVVRWLHVKRRPSRDLSATGRPAIITTADARAAGFGIDVEWRAVDAALRPTDADRPLELHEVESLDALRKLLSDERAAPRVIHFMSRSLDQGIVFARRDSIAGGGRIGDADAGKRRSGGGAAAREVVDSVAAILGRRRPGIVALSSCYTGRRLAPRVVVAGADVVVAFHQEVEDDNLPSFFGRLYEEVGGGVPIAEALRSALAFNRGQPDHDGLGAVTLWSARDLIGAGRGDGAAAGSAATEPGESRVVIACEPEEQLNYSVLHNSRGGLFRRFTAMELGTPAKAPLAVTVQLDTGHERPATCRFVCPAPTDRFARVDLAERVHLPLGAGMLRQRRETSIATVEITVEQGGEVLFHETRRLPVLPVDEWRDDRSGRHFLPSFILPRDPAVREMLSAAQPFLRAIGDSCDACFAGYQGAAATTAAGAVSHQVRAIWSALQHGYRLDYANPPPAYARASQRLRTPGEILRARRSTCIETSLLLAACWEHVGIEPVLFLSSGHAFCGYWATGEGRRSFLATLPDVALAPQPPGDDREKNHRFGGKALHRDVQEAWLLPERGHLEAIKAAVRNRTLVPVEATGATLSRSFEQSVREAREYLERLSPRDFDGMLDVTTAREHEVTPLPILDDGPVA